MERLLKEKREIERGKEKERNKMKKIIISVLILVFIAFEVGAQNKTEESATKMEAFLLKRGNLIIKNYYKLGKLSSLKVDMDIGALVVYEPAGENEATKGLQITITEYDKYRRSNTSFLDIDEVESLLKAVEYMSNLMNRWEKEKKEYIEVVFSTKDDFKIGFYQIGTQQTIFSSSGHVAKAEGELSKKDFSSFKSMIKQGLKLLEEWGKNNKQN